MSTHCTGTGGRCEHRLIGKRSGENVYDFVMDKVRFKGWHQTQLKNRSVDQNHRAIESIWMLTCMRTTTMVMAAPKPQTANIGATTVRSTPSVRCEQEHRSVDQNHRATASSSQQEAPVK